MTRVRGFITGRPARFLVVGVWNTVFGVLVFTVIQLALGDRVPYPAVLALAQVLAVLQAHAAQRRLVWRSSRPYLPELARFSVAYVAVYVANLALLALFVEVVGWPVLLSQYLSLPFVVGFSYLTSRFWTFRPPSG